MIKIKKLNKNAIIPKYNSEEAAGMDLHACIDEPITLKPLEIQLIPTGFAMELPKGYEGQIRPRSGLACKFGVTLANGIGTIDSDFRGGVMVGLINLSYKDYTVQPQDRIAQLVIAPVVQMEIEEVEELSDTERGSGGFGHSGFGKEVK